MNSASELPGLSEPFSGFICKMALIIQVPQACATRQQCNMVTSTGN